MLMEKKGILSYLMIPFFFLKYFKTIQIYKLHPHLFEPKYSTAISHV